MSAPTLLSEFELTTFSFEGKERDVYVSGSGPAVIVMAEMPGITPKVLSFAIRVRDLGLRVYLPRLFGEAGKEPGIAYTIGSIGPSCVSKEFGALVKRRTAPVTAWLRALAAHAHEECGGPGVGAIGMCFTGGFALGMMLDDRMIAPVLSQPSLPIGPGSAKAADVHLSPADLARVKERCADDGICVLGMRFTGDRLVPAARFATLRRELGDAFIGVEIDSSSGNPHGIRGLAHSVVTEDLVDEPGHPTHDALNQVLEFFSARLLPDSGAG